mgnify:CR=1 FL=1
MTDYFEEVKAVIIDVLKVDGDKIKPETSFIDDLKADSMDQFFLIDGLSERFGLNIADDDARAIRTVADAVRYVSEHAQK